MGSKKTSLRRAKSLSFGRHPLAQPLRSVPRRTTKRVINTYHQLEKRRRQAVARGDMGAETALSAEIEAQGGILRYQQASLQGQRQDRGGDSSRVLLSWLGLDKKELKRKALAAYTVRSPSLRMLEVGALSTRNACSMSGLFNMERIDLNSQTPGILQQDFLLRPRPRSDAERFDIISLSLVLNYVPQHCDRGEMLLRCLDFLHVPDDASSRKNAADNSGVLTTYSSAEVESGPSFSRYFPSIFMVLPAPCVANSRYLTEEHLTAMMATLGFDLIAFKGSQRLVFYLWKRVRLAPTVFPNFSKKELRSGVARNNFAIVLQGREEIVSQ